MIDVARTVGFAAWLGAMWFAAASLDRSEGPRSPADALRDTLLVTVGGAFVLGLCGILNPWALVAWPLCIAAVALATRRDRSTVLRRTFRSRRLRHGYCRSSSFRSWRGPDSYGRSSTATR